MSSYLLRLSSSGVFFITDPDNYALDGSTEWNLARYELADDDEDGDGEWIYQKIEFDEDKINPGYPCGNITWWGIPNAETKAVDTVVSFEGPAGRNLGAFSQFGLEGTLYGDTPGYAYVNDVGETGDVRVRWQKKVWRNSKEIETPDYVIGACIREATDTEPRLLHIICAPRDHIEAPLTKLTVYAYVFEEEDEEFKWELRMEHVFTDVVEYPPTFFACSRTGTEARGVVLVKLSGSFDIPSQTIPNALSLFGLNTIPREVIINLVTYQLDNFPETISPEELEKQLILEYDEFVTRYALCSHGTQDPNPSTGDPTLPINYTVNLTQTTISVPGLEFEANAQVYPYKAMLYNNSKFEILDAISYDPDTNLLTVVRGAPISFTSTSSNRGRLRPINVSGIVEKDTECDNRLRMLPGELLVSVDYDDSNTVVKLWLQGEVTHRVYERCEVVNDGYMLYDIEYKYHYDLRVEGGVHHGLIIPLQNYSAKNDALFIRDKYTPVETFDSFVYDYILTSYMMEQATLQWEYSDYQGDFDNPHAVGLYLSTIFHLDLRFLNVLLVEETFQTSKTGITEEIDLPVGVAVARGTVGGDVNVSYSSNTWAEPIIYNNGVRTSLVEQPYLTYDDSFFGIAVESYAWAVYTTVLRQTFSVYILQPFEFFIEKGEFFQQDFLSDLVSRGAHDQIAASDTQGNFIVDYPKDYFLSEISVESDKQSQIVDVRYISNSDFPNDPGLVFELSGLPINPIRFGSRLV